MGFLDLEMNLVKCLSWCITGNPQHPVPQTGAELSIVSIVSTGIAHENRKGDSKKKNLIFLASLLFIDIVY